MIKIAIDAMGGDQAPHITVEGAMLAVQRFDDIELTLYGNETKINPLLKAHDRIKVVHTTDMISMDEKEAINTMRRDTTSSMAMGLIAAKEGDVDAFVTAGPTGPFVAGAHLKVKRLTGMKRTALAPIFPQKNGYTMLLDVGANTETRPEHLVQYAISATIYAKEVLGVVDPKIGLVNNGSEEGKGRELEQEAFYLLKDTKQINFLGNVEMKEFFTTEATILVTDGFTGNAILKTVEGTLKSFSSTLKKEIKSSIFGILGALIMKKNLDRVKKTYDIAEIGGAILLGVSKPVVKAHGSSTAYEYMSAIKQARALVEKEVVEKIERELNI